MINQLPPTTHIIANGFPEAYYKAIKKCLECGALKWRDYNGPVLTKDIISLIEINDPLQKPMLHPNFPTKELHLQEYIKQFERGYDWRQQGFAYSYIDRLINYPRTDLYSNHTGYYRVKQSDSNVIDQIKTIKEKFADIINKGGDCLVSNRYQAITWVPERDLFVDEDQPCFQRAQFFIYSFPKGDTPGKGEVHIMWRSRDLYAAWNSNMVALNLFFKKEIFGPNNIKIVRCIDFDNSLHIYQNDWEDAEKVKPAGKIRYS